MVLRVVEALTSAPGIEKRIICGPPQELVEREPRLQELIRSGAVVWIPNHSSPSSSTSHALQTIDENRPVLVTTSDHALLNARMVETFCTGARQSGADLAVALTDHSSVVQAYPETRRTAIKLRDGAFCSCNLFAFMTPASRRAADFWRKAENQRKKPIYLARVLGWRVLLPFLLGRLTLEKGLRAVSNRLGLKIEAVMLPFPEAAIDVDTSEDWELAQSIIERW
jgi:CTP:molybdopterin cytidylyltransferase MocA